MINKEAILKAFEQIYNIELDAVSQTVKGAKPEEKHKIEDLSFGYVLGLKRGSEILSIILKDV